MIQLLGIIVILCCGQGVYSQDGRSVLANFTQARKECDTNGTVLPWTSADNTLVEKLQMTNKSVTWIDLTISPSPWNWITDDEYTVHYDQGCYNLSSLPIQPMSNDINTCLESCSCYLYVGVQAISEDNISCACTNDIEIASAVSEYKCNSACKVTSNNLLCGNNNSGTFRLWSTRELSSLPTKEVIWNDNPGINISSPFLCASLSIRASNDKPPYITLLPQDCTDQLPAICESDNGTVTHMDRVSWFGARQLCREHGMKSVRVYSPNQTNLLKLNEKEGWTSLRGWTWRSQGREICDTVPSNWSAGYPDKSEGECIIVLKHGSWKNVQCDTQITSLCATPLTTSSPAVCRSSIPSTSANTSYHTTMMEARTTSGPIANTSSDQLATTTSEPRTAATPELITNALSSHTTSGAGEVGVAVGAVIAVLVLAAVVVIVIVFLCRRKQASPGGSSLHTKGDPCDDKSLRPECDQGMDGLTIYARPSKDPLTDGVILVVENSLYGSVDPDDDELPSSRSVAPAIGETRGPGTAVYEFATASMGDEVNDDSASRQEAGDSSNSSMNDQIPDDDTLMIDNSLYDSTDSTTDGLPVP